LAIFARFVNDDPFGAYSRFSIAAWAQNHHQSVQSAAAGGFRQRRRNIQGHAALLRDQKFRMRRIFVTDASGVFRLAKNCGE